MDLINTKYRVTSKSYETRGIKTYVGRVRYYEKDQYLWSESTGIHRPTAIDAQTDAFKLAFDRLNP